MKHLYDIDCICYLFESITWEGIENGQEKNEVFVHGVVCK